MLRNILRDMGRSLVILALFTLICGAMYPLAVAGVARVLFPWQAGGSLMVREGRLAGSYLIGQRCGDARYFSTRPSATAWNTLSSGGSNAGPTSAELRDSVAQRRTWWTRCMPGAASEAIPPDLLTASGSGLDPHISPEAARFQIPRIAAARRLSADETRALDSLITHATEAPQLFVFGQPRVNVMALNFALDDRTGH